MLWIRGHKTRQNWYHRLTKRMYGWYGRASFKAKIRKTQRSISSPNQWLRIDNVKEAFSFNVTNLSCWCNYCVNLSSLFRNVTIQHSKFWKERNVLCSSSNMKVVVLWLKRNWNFIVIFMQARTFTKKTFHLVKKTWLRSRAKCIFTLFVNIPGDIAKFYPFLAKINKPRTNSGSLR